MALARNDKQTDQRVQDIAAEALRVALVAYQSAGGGAMPSYRRVLYDAGWPATRPTALYVDAYGGPASPSWLLPADLYFPTLPIPGETGPDTVGLWQTEVAGVGSLDRAPAYLDPLGPFTDANLYVDPTRATNGDGSAFSPYNNLPSALAAASDGQRIGVDGGTLELNSRLFRSTSWATGLEVVALNGERPVLQFASGVTGADSRVLTLAGAREVWHGFDIRGWNEGGAGIYLDGTAYGLSAIRASHGNGPGIFVFGGAGGHRLRDIAVYRVGDGFTADTNVPDCIAFTSGVGSVVQDIEMARVFVANGPDDGLDLFRARGVRAWNVVAYDCGRYWNGVNAGDGNGVKMGGGDSDAGDNQVVGFLAINNRNGGVAHNQARNDSGSNPNIVAAYGTVVDNGGIGVDAGGDVASQPNVLRDTILNGNGTARYVGANALERRTTVSLSIADPGLVNPTGGDYALDVGSLCIGAGITGDDLEAPLVDQASATGAAENIGASITSLRMWRYWSQQDLT
jgi:hypothetical protein